MVVGSIIESLELKLGEPKLSTILILCFGVFLFYSANAWKPTPGKAATKVKKGSSLKDKVVTKPKIDAVGLDFDWAKLDPVKHFPFKNAKYQLNMGIKNLEPQDYLVLDPTYKTKLLEKYKIVTNNHPDYPSEKDLKNSTLFYLPEAEEAVREYYDFVMEYVCCRWPQYFVKTGANQIHNKITNDFVPANADTSTDAEKYLIDLVKTIEEDFIILLKDPSKEHEIDGTEYYFKAGVFAFAAGFNPRDRFDTPLSFIHHPIPGYEAKLKMSMNRFFDKLQPHRFVTRANFSVQTHGKYYVDDSNKGHNLPDDVEQKPIAYEDLDFENGVHYRSERQTLTKLPKSGAVVFTIRTYLTPMAELKNEPLEVRERLAGAIKLLPEDIAKYKRSKEWGPAVVQYLEES